MSKESPSFISNIPAHLLEECSAKDKFLMEQISIIGQKSDYLLNEQAKHSEELKEIRLQTQATNGRVNKHDKGLAVFEEIAIDLKEIVSTKRFIGKIAGSKWSWIVGSFVVVGIIQVFTNPILREWLLKFV